MSVLKFSDSKLESLKYDGKRTDYRDLCCTGLILRVGKESKIFYGTIDRKMKKIGNFSIFSNGIRYEEAEEIYKDLKHARKKMGTGFSEVTLEGYIDNQYRKDRVKMKNPASEKNIDNIKRQFSHALRKRCIDLSDRDYETYEESAFHLTESTQRKAYYAFSALLNTLVHFNRIAVNPLKKRTFNSNLKHAINTHSPTREEIYELIFSDRFGIRTKRSRGYSLATRLIAVLTVDCGCRPGEARLNYRSNFILDDKPRMRIPANICKTSKPRDVPLSNTISEKLSEYIRDEYVPNPNGLMFFNPSTNQVYAEGCYRAVWKEVKKHYALQGRFYDFRHTFATKLYVHTGNIKLVADTIGDSVDTASKYYADGNVELTRELMTGMD